MPPGSRPAALTRPSDQPGDRLRADALLDLDDVRLGETREEGAADVVGVEAGRVDRRLQVEAEDGVGEEERQRPLVLLVAAGGAEREVRLAAAERERRRQRRPRPLPRRERVRVLGVEPEHLRAGAEGEAEPRDDG
jgi:hypothetical protein